MKRFALLLFAGLFGLTTLQTAGAQDDTGDHDVTISVDLINSITVNQSPTISIGSSSEINSWIEGGAATFDVTTNAITKRKITVDASSSDGGSNFGLRVKTADDGKIDATEPGDPLILTALGNDSDFSNADNFLTDFGNVDKSGLDLTYEGKVNASFDPGSDATVNVTYTLTSQN